MRAVAGVAALAGAAALAAGCGGASRVSGVSVKAPPATAPATPASPGPQGLLGAGGKALYAGGDWAVVLRGARVAVARRVANRWVLDRVGGVTIAALGPHGIVGPVSQAAIEVKARAPLVETAIWVDGRELDLKGGGSATEGTVYGGTPKLAPGVHRAVGYGRTDTGGAATTWTFRVR